MSKTPRKTVLISGTSQGGIGDALAKEFHRQGLRVIATARNLAKVQHLKDLGLDVLPLDVVDHASIQDAVKSVEKFTGGKLDILINNSGNGYNQSMLDSDVDIAKKMFDVNVFAIIEVTKAFAPQLIASKGKVVNIGSIAGIIPLPWGGYYDASKAAVNHLTRALRIELAPLGVDAINITTGVVKTKFFDNLNAPKLPANSVYAPAKDLIEPVMAGAGLEEAGMEADVFAAAVVKNVLKSNSTKDQWVGGNTFIVWFASTFGWATIWDVIVPRLFKIGEVTKRIQAAGKSK
ncbi:NADPH-dependent 1-acyldihydroxyacetone phosphate reductase [Lachnellula occidentalis]|uniref:NADPH-dependent 1-acyldihydroxyacetone phosphate reductase n=1 Tax=Lachnellula occidentalis TaxID=215460 RepID=A0A8H8S3F2_9HELO|nr:NADPH-dependent 1-acyldihydroxyacetone phosphate reductase [Lachnellula occidentalis]